MITQSELKSRLHYDPVTGVFTWLVQPARNVRAGSRAGCSDGRGYIKITIDRKLYFAHRLAFLYITGKFPPDSTDHINGVTGDNRWENLRPVSHTENNRNRKLHKTNTSGVAGVRWSERGRAWASSIRTGSKKTHLGWTPDFFEAVCVRKSAELRLGYHKNHGRKGHVV